MNSELAANSLGGKYMQAKFHIPSTFVNQYYTQMYFTESLLHWYHENKRDLPWRKNTHPYQVWISEVILQQTRIEQGLPYYNRFMAAFPTIESLALAEEEIVLKLWQGLGYYSRARNMLETAKIVLKKFNGRFPSDYNAIRSLKGIGDYTAAAIASISFNLPYPVVDGNVLRFISRHFGIQASIDLSETKKEITGLASRYISQKNPGDFNQAMMEFGSTVCKPNNPSCTDCIFCTSCLSFKNNLVDQIPVRVKNAVPRKRYINYFVITYCVDSERMILLNKRSGKDIWKNLFDFPSVETEEETDPSLLIKTAAIPKKLMDHGAFCNEISKTYTHLLTHQRLVAKFFHYQLIGPPGLQFFEVPLSKIHQYPVPRLIDRFLNDHKLI